MGPTDSHFEKKPDFIDVQFNQSDLSIYLQLLNPQTVEGLYFEASDEFLHRDFLNSVAESVAMKKVDQLEKTIRLKAREYDFRGEVFPLVVMGLSKIVDEVTGRNLQQDFDMPEGEKLVCRCFGVSEEKICTLLSEAESPNLKLITDETMAGGACGTCLSDLKTLVSLHAPEVDQILSAKGMTEVELAKEISSLMKENNSTFELSRIVGTDVWIKAAGPNPFPELESLQKLSSESLGLPLDFHLSH